MTRLIIFPRHTTLLLTLLTLQSTTLTTATIPTAAIDLYDAEPNTNTNKPFLTTLLASQALFGTYPPYSSKHNHKPSILTHPPSDDPDLCNEALGGTNYKTTSSTYQPLENKVVLVPRGKCTFERKALSAQRLGAKGVIIYGTLGSRYSLNTTGHDDNDDYEYSMSDILYPQDKYDYDCSYGHAMVSSSLLSFNPLPYNSNVNDARLSGSGDNWNDCAIASDDGPRSFEKTCASRRCLLTGKIQRTEDEKTKMEACCAWDLHVLLYADPDISKEEEVVRIPSFYVTMEEADVILGYMASSKSGTRSIAVTMYARYRPTYNVSSVMIWALGVFVAFLASWISASEYREERKLRMALDQQGDTHHDAHHDDAATRRILQDDQVGGSTIRSRSRSPPSPRHQQQQHQQQQVVSSEPFIDDESLNQENIPPSSSSAIPGGESLELTIQHAIGFIIMASASLMILFYLEIYNIVKVMYAFGCSGALTQVLFHPLYRSLSSRFNNNNNNIEKQACIITTFDIGPITYLDILSITSGYGLGLLWLTIALTVLHPESMTFFWIVQDIMGTCMCIMFLSIIKLNSIKVACVLLIVAFCYDIFFVFITPLLVRGGKSVMIAVATSGGPPKADPSWCEKYPYDDDCKGGDPLPMLLTMPRFGDYQGGASLLGLGDIVLPGLLLSFAARLDEGKRLVGFMSGGARHSNMCPDTSSSSLIAPSNTNTTHRCIFNILCGICHCIHNSGYFIPLVISYAIGLSMANIAVYLMDMGQPALLYLVPCCLGTMVCIGFRRGELNDLWNGPKILNEADRLVYGHFISDDDDGYGAAADYDDDDDVEGVEGRFEGGGFQDKQQEERHHRPRSNGGGEEEETSFTDVPLLSLT